MRRAFLRWTGGALLAMLAATTGVRAQLTTNANLYEDPELTRMLVQTTTAMGVLGAADPVTVLLIAPMVAANITWHELLTIARIDAEMNTMTALMTEAFREQNEQIRGAVTSANRLINKLRADIAYYEQRRPEFRNGPPTALAMQREYEVYQEVQARLKRLQAGGDIDLVTKGEDVLAAFDEMRSRVVARGMFSRVQLIANAKTLAPKLAAFSDAAVKADALVASRHKLKDGTDVDASPMQQLRIKIDNASQDTSDDAGGLVFSVRTWERTNASPEGAVQDCQGGTYTLPLALNADGTPKQWTNQDGSAGEWRDSRWTVVWPKTSSPEFTTVGAGANTPGANDIRLPSTVSLPVTPRGRIEVRVATYGPLRKRIRWSDVVGRVVRPEMSSLPRTFYWFAYEAVQTDMSGGYSNLKSRWFPVEENYTWTLSGAWSEQNAGPLKARLESTQGPARTELRRNALDQGGNSLLRLQNDRAVWCMPTSVETILAEPFLSAEIRGDMKARHVTQRDTEGQEQPETGSGQIAITMQRW